MEYYVIDNGQIRTSENKEVLEKYYGTALELPEDYEYGKYIVDSGELILNPNWEQEQAQKEQERIAKLHLTRGDVFRGILLAKGVTRSQMRALIEQMPDETVEQKIAKEYALIDFDEALEFYRGVALIDAVGSQLGITPEQMTKFFETNDYKELIDSTSETESTEENENTENIEHDKQEREDAENEL